MAANPIIAALRANSPAPARQASGPVALNYPWMQNTALGTPTPVTPKPVTPTPVIPTPVTPTAPGGEKDGINGGGYWIDLGDYGGRVFIPDFNTGNTPTPVTPTPVTPTPVTPTPVTPTPVIPTPVIPTPVTPTPVTPTPVTPTPVTPTPVAPNIKSGDQVLLYTDPFTGENVYGPDFSQYSQPTLNPQPAAKPVQPDYNQYQDLGQYNFTLPDMY
jgi:autotransporter family porin